MRDIHFHHSCLCLALRLIRVQQTLFCNWAMCSTRISIRPLQCESRRLLFNLEGSCFHMVVYKRVPKSCSRRDAYIRRIGFSSSHIATLSQSPEICCLRRQSIMRAFMVDAALLALMLAGSVTASQNALKVSIARTLPPCPSNHA